jgi:hypothetical protein
MFDPTIFDNLKTVVEGTVYDLDLNEDIRVVGRQDTIDLASMSRAFALRFIERSPGAAVAELRLFMGLADLSGELLNRQGGEPGCRPEIVFELPIKKPEDCQSKVRLITEIWGSRPRVETTISYSCLADGALPEPLPDYLCSLSLSFDRKIGEEHVDDLVDIVDYCRKTLIALNK